MGKATRIGLFAALALLTGAAAAQTPAAKPPLRVATRVIAPFVMKEKGQLTGFSIELWEALAKQLDMPFVYLPSETLPGLFEAVGSGQADLAVAAISITAEREKIYDFSQPMFDSGLQIMISASRTAPAVLPTLLGLFMSRTFLELIGILGILMLLPVPLVWLSERSGMVKGGHTLGQLAQSLWWSSSTLAGQATEMPVSFLGRMTAVVWMFVGVVFVSYFTATITAGLTVRQLEAGISGPADLTGKVVASVRGSTAADYLRSQGIEVRESRQIDDALKALEGGKVDAVVYDAPVLLYYAAHEGRGKVQMAGPVFRSEAYGILFAEGSPLRKNVNEALLKLRESGAYRDIYRRWFAGEKDGG